MPPADSSAEADLLLHQAEQAEKDAPKAAALIAEVPAELTPPCVVCGWPVLPGATCTADGTVAK